MVLENSISRNRAKPGVVDYDAEEEKHDNPKEILMLSVIPTRSVKREGEKKKEKSRYGFQQRNVSVNLLTVT